MRKILGWRKEERPGLEIEDMVETARHADWCLLIDEKLYVEPGSEFSNQEHRGVPWESYCSYYKADYMAKLFPEAEVAQPVSPEWQHCCIIRNTQ